MGVTGLVFEQYLLQINATFRDVQIMSYEEIAIYVDTKARYTGCNTNRIFQVKSSLRSDEGQVKVR